MRGSSKGNVVADSIERLFPVKTTEIRDAALDYAERRWRVVPLHDRDKRPYPKAWQKVATNDPEVITGWFQQWPDANVGIVLGEESGIIDIECDDEQAEQTLRDLFDGDIPNTPTYSARRGKHRLFKWNEAIPFPEKNGFKIGALEFRTGNGGKGAQSVFPPSIHPSGLVYTWLVDPSEADVAELPETVIANLSVYSVEPSLFDAKTPSKVASKPQAKPQEHWDAIASGGVSEGGRNETAASFIGKLLRSLSDPFDNGAVSNQWTLIFAWNNSNRPPLPEKELRATFDSILRRHREKVTAERAEKIGTRQVDRDPKSGQQSIAPWKLTLVLSKPRKWKLYSPWWEHKTSGGYIELTSSELRNPKYIAEQAAEQAQHWIDLPSFTKFWLGDKMSPEPGMADSLMSTSEREECSPEENRDLSLADKLLTALQPIRKAEEPDPKGAARQLSDGSIWFKHERMLTDMQYGVEPPTGRELSKLLKQIGAEDKQFTVEGGNRRFKRLPDSAMKSLRQRATAGAEPMCGEQTQQPQRLYS